MSRIIGNTVGTPLNPKKIAEIVDTANALKGKGEGAVLSLSDISPVEHTLKVKLSESGAEVRVCGLNLWDEQVEIGGISSSDGQNADNVANVLRTKNFIKVMPGKLYYVKCPSGLVSTGGLIQIYRYDENKNFLGYGSTGVENGQFNSAGWHYIRFVIRKEYGMTYNHDICLSFDDEATNGTYEPYKGAVYTPDADGRVEGVKSLYPTTTLMTDAEGAVIEAEYNRDLNKAYQALVDSIVALGGAV